MDIITRLEERIKSFPFTDHGFAKLEKPLSIEVYKEWLNRGHHGEMQYLASHYEQKEQPQKLQASAQTAIVVLQNYLPHPYPIDLKLSGLKIAKYAQGTDYHIQFKNQLDELCMALKKDHPDEEFIAYTDSSPVLERDLAHRAGLGWFGKNTCLLNRKHGSYFFIGEIYTSLVLQVDLNLPVDHCGNCQKCIDSCPTQALLDGRQMDATKCISYLNIEAKSVPNKELRPLLSDWFFGCDICQDVCPWNQKVFSEKLMNSKPSSNILNSDLKWILESSNKQLMRELKFSPLSRAGGRGLKRNALLVIGNLKITELRSCVENYLTHPELSELAQWSIDQLSVTD